MLFFISVLSAVVVIFLGNPSLMPSSLMAILLFFVFSPVVSNLERRGVPRGAAIASLFIICGMGLAGGVSWVAPRAAQEIDAFQQGSAQYTSDLKLRLEEKERYLRKKFPFLPPLDATTNAINWIKGSGSKILGAIPDLASHLFMALLMVPFLTFIMLKDAHIIRRSLLSLVPNRYFETVYALSSRMVDEMGGYVSARILEAGLVMGMVTIPCIILKIPYAVLLGVFAGATNPIPYLGPVLGAIPGLLFAILDPRVENQLLYVSLIYIIANAVDMILIFPLVVAKIVNLHPLVVIVCVIIGSQIFGIVGMIVAVPLTSILKILLQEVYARIYHNGAG
jgi:putative permease